MSGIMQRWKGKVAGALGIFKVLQIVAGGAISTLMRVGGLISVNVTTVFNSATNVTQTLMSYAVPANTLDATGRGLFIRAWGRFAGNAAPKSLTVTIGGKTYASGTSTQSGATWSFDAVVSKTGSNAQNQYLTGKIGTTAIAPISQTDTASDSAAITISVSTADASAAQSDVLQDGLLIEVF